MDRRVAVKELDWGFRMNPQPQDTDREFSYSNWTATANDIVISWLAFRELLSKESIVVGCGPSRIVLDLFDRGWSRRSLGVNLALKDSQIIDRMSANPYDFCIAYDAGVDIMSRSYSCIMPWQLPALIDNFQPEATEMTSGLRLFENARSNAEKEASERDEKKKSASEKVFSTLQTSPFILPNPIKALFFEYGIDSERVYVRKSLGGLFTFSHGASAPVHSIRDVRPTGNWLIGQVVFRDDTADVVVWESVFLPRKKAQYAKKSCG